MNNKNTLFKEWDIKNIPGDKNKGGGFVMTICAKRFSGKTHICNWVFDAIKDRYDKNNIYVFSKTANCNMEYPYQFTIEKNRKDNYDNNFLHSLINDQKELKMQQKKGLTTEIKNVLIILDDLLADDDIRKIKNSAILELACNSRHIDISVIFITQLLSAQYYPVSIRKNTDVFIAFKIYDESTLKMASKSFLSLLGSTRGEEVINDITNREDYMAIIVENYRSTAIKDYQDFVFYYKAPKNLPNFTSFINKSNYKTNNIILNNNDVHFDFKFAGDEDELFFI